MKTSFKIMLLAGSLLLAVPTFAQTDGHTGHHPAPPPDAPPVASVVPATLAAPADAAQPAQPAASMMIMAPPVTGNPDHTMGAGMSPGRIKMMKACMRHDAKRHATRRAARHRHQS